MPEEQTRLGVSEADIAACVKYPDVNVVDFNRVAFEFDRVFDPEKDQVDVYDEVEPVVKRYKLGLILTRNCHNLTRIFTQCHERL